MKPVSSSTQSMVWGGLGIVIVAIAVGYIVEAPSKAKRSVSEDLPIISTLDPFALADQEGRRVSLDDLRGKVWVSDVIFTRCAVPCLQMTQRMKELDVALGSDAPVNLVTFTTDPEYDTSDVLKTYARRLGITSPRWRLITGPKTDIFKVMVGGIKFTALEKKPEERKDPSDLFIHSTIFIVVDKQGRVRKAVEAMEPDFKPQLLEVINRLVKE